MKTINFADGQSAICLEPGSFATQEEAEVAINRIQSSHENCYFKPIRIV
jgi:hypothetical protein